MSWLHLAIASAVTLGLYDVSKKSAVTGNAVLPTLWLSSTVSWLLLLPVGAASLAPRTGTPPLLGLGVVALSAFDHAAVLLKAAIVTLSWVLTFSAVKHLPISLAGPIRATAPMFTLLGAVLLFAERPSTSEWCGIAIVVVGYVAFALIGRSEGIRLRTNRWLWVLLGGTLVGAGSGLYDKLLLQNMHIPPTTLQFWFTTYNVCIQTPLTFAMWWPHRAKDRFQWRASILVVGGLLVLADQLYFRALASEDALLSVVSLIRRCNVLVSFALGGWLFRERLLASKALGLALLLLGLLVLHL